MLVFSTKSFYTISGYPTRVSLLKTMLFIQQCLFPLFSNFTNKKDLRTVPLVILFRSSCKLRTMSLSCSFDKSDTPLTLTKTNSYDKLLQEFVFFLKVKVKQYKEPPVQKDYEPYVHLK